MPIPVRIVGCKIDPLDGKSLTPKAYQAIRNAFTYFAKKGENAFDLFCEGGIAYRSTVRTTVSHNSIISNGRTTPFKCTFCYQEIKGA
jgi:hypothetical protein